MNIPYGIMIIADTTENKWLFLNCSLVDSSVISPTYLLFKNFNIRDGIKVRSKTVPIVTPR